MDSVLKFTSEVTNIKLGNVPVTRLEQNKCRGSNYTSPVNMRGGSRNWDEEILQSFHVNISWACRVIENQYALYSCISLGLFVQRLLLLISFHKLLAQGIFATGMYDHSHMPYLTHNFCVKMIILVRDFIRECWSFLFGEIIWKMDHIFIICRIW